MSPPPRSRLLPDLVVAVWYKTNKAERDQGKLRISALRDRMGKAARRIVAERFEADAVARKYLEIHSQVLAPTLSR